MRNQKGFTLIEMIVVMAIVTILASVLYPRISGYVATNKENFRANQEYMVNKALIQYYALTGNYYRQTFVCNEGDTIGDSYVAVMIDELNKKTGSMISKDSGEFDYIKAKGTWTDIREIKVIAP